jgi:riboflavin kinase / FMN adenylyltransferase
MLGRARSVLSSARFATRSIAPRDRAAELCSQRRLAISGHAPRRRERGFHTLKLGFGHARPAMMGILVMRVHGLADPPLPGGASPGVRPAVEAAGRT